MYADKREQTTLRECPEWSQKKKQEYIPGFSDLLGWRRISVFYESYK